MNLHSEKLAILRNLMKENDIDLYIIPTTDPHLGENIPDHWRIVSWLTGFTGSSATVVITELFAGLWTDSRYILQADKQLLDSEFIPVSYTHLRAHETVLDIVCRLLLEKK